MHKAGRWVVSNGKAGLASPVCFCHPQTHVFFRGVEGYSEAQWLCKFYHGLLDKCLTLAGQWTVDSGQVVWQSEILTHQLWPAAVQNAGSYWAFNIFRTRLVQFFSSTIRMVKTPGLKFCYHLFFLSLIITTIIVWHSIDQWKVRHNPDLAWPFRPVSASG